MVNSKSLPLPPGDFGPPLIGKAPNFFTDPNFPSKQHAKYGPLFKTRLFTQPTVFMKGPEAVRFLFAQEGDRITVSWPASLKALLGPLSLALQSGGIHASRRRLMAQAFQPRALEGYIETMADISDRYFQQWAQMSARDGSLTWYPQLRRYTFDIACKLLVGLEDASTAKLGDLFEIWSAGLFTLPINLPWATFGRAMRSRDKMLVALEDLIRDRQQSPQSPATPDALELLLNAEDDEGKKLTIDELKDQVLLLLFAGHETLTSALTSFCLLIAQNPNVRAKAEAEQNALEDRALTLETLKEMTYLEQVLNEVLRLVPPVGGGFRQVLETCEFGGYQIPAGWMVIYEIKQTHEETDLYARAKEFDPAHFTPEQLAQRRKPFSYIPFGGGLRECIGKEFARLEMKIFAAKLLRNHRWELLPDQNLDFTITPVPIPKDGLKVRFF